MPARLYPTRSPPSSHARSVIPAGRALLTISRSDSDLDAIPTLTGRWLSAATLALMLVYTFATLAFW